MVKLEFVLRCCGWDKNEMVSENVSFRMMNFQRNEHFTLILYGNPIHNYLFKFIFRFISKFSYFSPDTIRTYYSTIHSFNPIRSNIQTIRHLFPSIFAHFHGYRVSYDYLCRLFCSGFSEWKNI